MIDVDIKPTFPHRISWKCTKRKFHGRSKFPFNDDLYDCYDLFLDDEPLGLTLWHKENEKNWRLASRWLNPCIDFTVVRDCESSEANSAMGMTISHVANMLNMVRDKDDPTLLYEVNS